MTIKTEVTETINAIKAIGSPTAAIFEGAIRTEDDALLDTFDALYQAKAIEGAIKIYYQNKDGEPRLTTIPITPKPEEKKA